MFNFLQQYFDFEVLLLNVSCFIFFDAIVNGNVFLISFSDCLLLVYRSIIVFFVFWFCIVNIELLLALYYFIGYLRIFSTMAAITRYHKLSALSTKMYCLTTLEARRPKSRCQAGFVPSEVIFLPSFFTVSSFHALTLCSNFLFL